MLRIQGLGSSGFKFRDSEVRNLGLGIRDLGFKDSRC